MDLLERLLVINEKNKTEFKKGFCEAVQMIFDLASHIALKFVQILNASFSNTKTANQ